jgi:hypothetical protein
VAERIERGDRVTYTAGRHGHEYIVLAVLEHPRTLQPYVSLQGPSRRMAASPDKLTIVRKWNHDQHA